LAATKGTHSVSSDTKEDRRIKDVTDEAQPIGT